MKRLVLLLSMLFVVSCTLTPEQLEMLSNAASVAAKTGVELAVQDGPITDEQITSLSHFVGTAARVGAEKAGPLIGLDSGFTAGIAGAIGTGVYLGAMALMRKLRKKQGEG